MSCIFVVWDFYCSRNFKNSYLYWVFFISQEVGRFHRNSITIAKLELMGITEIAERPRVCDCIMLGDYEDGSPRAQQSGICFMKIKCYFSHCTDFIHNDVWEYDIHIFYKNINSPLQWQSWIYNFRPN